VSQIGPWSQRSDPAVRDAQISGLMGYRSLFVFVFCFLLGGFLFFIFIYLLSAPAASRRRLGWRLRATRGGGWKALWYNV
jgi:hypothetical protein